MMTITTTTTQMKWMQTQKKIQVNEVKKIYTRIQIKVKAQMFSSLSDGTSTIKGWHLFRTRDYSILMAEDKGNFKYALRIFPIKKTVNEYNYSHLIDLGKPIAYVPSKIIAILFSVLRQMMQRVLRKYYVYLLVPVSCYVQILPHIMDSSTVRLVLL